MLVGVPVEAGYFLGGGESMGVLGHVADEVDHLLDVVVSEEVMRRCHNIYKNINESMKTSIIIKLMLRFRQYAIISI